MRFCKTLLVAMITLSSLSGCALFSSEEDIVTMSPLPKVQNQFEPTQHWSVSVGDGIGQDYTHLHPAYQEGTLYAASRHGLIKALDIASGKEKWVTSLAEKTSFFAKSHSALLSGGLVVSGNKIYVGSENAHVYALNTSDGKEIWKKAVAGEVVSQPVVSDGIVLIHTSNGVLQALNESDGAQKWSVNLDMPALSVRGESAPSVAYGAAIIGGDNGRVSAVLLQQGQIIWQQRISQPIGATEISRLNDVDISPVVADGIVYVVGYNGNLAALDLRTGQIMWKRDIGSVNQFIVDASRIYLVDQNDRIMALNTEGGIEVWKQSDLLHRGLTAPALYDGYLVVGDREGYLHWVNLADGRFVAQQKIDSSGFLSQPITADNKLIIQARGGKVYAISR